MQTDASQTAQLAQRLFERKERQKEAVLSVISHEFKSPLSSVLVCAQLLGRRPEVGSSKEASELLGTIQQGGLLLNLLVQNVLMREKLPKFELSSVVVEKLLHDVLNLLSPLSSHKIQVSVQNSSSGEVFSNHTALLQILLNLGSNAIKFSGQKPISICVTQGPKKDQLSIAVEDDGPGVSESFVPKLFLAYQREGIASGTGLGLSISFRMAQEIRATLLYDPKRFEIKRNSFT